MNDQLKAKRRHFLKLAITCDYKNVMPRMPRNPNAGASSWMGYRKRFSNWLKGLQDAVITAQQ